MSGYFLLSRLLLHFDGASENLLSDLSAITLTPDGSLWVGSDELLSLERLSPIEPYIYGNHQQFPIADFIDLFNLEDEIDIEGMDYSDHYLWFTGSHSTKRKKAKGKKPDQDILRLSTVKSEANRYLLARIPIIDGNPLKTCNHPDNPDLKLTAACLQKTEDQQNILMEALKNDEHFGTYITSGLPSKENGFDIEGLAVKGNRIFLGLRGPVLRGWAIILGLEVEESELGILTLKEIGQNGEKYHKYFVELNGLGIRELCLDNEDLIILAGPTMDLEGEMRMFRLKDALALSETTIISQDSQRLQVLFDLPFTIGSDHAEGLALYPCLGQPNSLLVVYDSPDPARLIEDHAVFVDVFRLKR